MKAIVLGSGAWGTALALLLLRAGHQVSLWTQSEEKALQMARSRQNPKLTGVLLPEGLHITADDRAAREAELVVFAVPSIAVRETAVRFAPRLRQDALLVSAAKGIERGTHLRMSQLIQEACGGPERIAALSGPSHAEEVARGMPTGCVAASPERHCAQAVQNAFMTPDFRVYTNPDLTGVELCAALKNVVALGCGIADGLGFGDNAKALVITRAMAEAASLCLAAGGLRETCAGLAGMGDLIVTCTSVHSRNRRAGLLLGQGKGVQEALREVGAVVEGYYAAESVWELSRSLGARLPISEAIYGVLYREVPPAEAIRGLMLREKKTEFAGLRWENDEED